MSQQPKHIRDIASILVSLAEDEVDWPYLNRWIIRLGLEAVWREVKHEVNQLLG